MLIANLSHSQFTHMRWRHNNHLEMNQFLIFVKLVIVGQSCFQRQSISNVFCASYYRMMHVKRETYTQIRLYIMSRIGDVAIRHLYLLTEQSSYNWRVKTV